MSELLLLPSGWPKVLLLVFVTGMLVAIWLRRNCLESLTPGTDGMQVPSADASDPPDAPSRCLVVVARNEEDALPDLLGDIERLLDEDSSLDVLLADDASVDDTRSLLQDFCSAQPRCRLLKAETVSGKPAWLRLAVSQCQASQVLFTDADCRLPRRWSLALGGLLDEQTVAVGGLVLLESMDEPDLAARWQRLNWMLLSGVGSMISLRSSAASAAPSLWGANLAFRRGVLDAWGGYPELVHTDVNEDLTLARQLARHGAVTRLVAFPRESRVRTRAESWLGVAGQLSRWGLGLPRLAPLHAAAVLAALAWLASLALLFLLRPVLGLVLATAAHLVFHAFMAELATRLHEEPVSAADSALYLLAWPPLALLALWRALRGESAWGQHK